MKLWVRIALAFQTLILLVMIAVGSLLFYMEKRQLVHSQIDQQNDSAEKLAQVCIESDAEHNDLILLNYVLSLKRSPEVLYVSFLDETGKVVVHSDMAQVGTSPNDAATRALISSQELIRQDAAGGAILDIGVPVKSQGRKIGFARIGYDNKLLSKQVNTILHSALRRIVIVGCFSLFLGLLGSILLARGVTNPVQSLVSATKKIGKGELTYRISMPRNDEIGQLATSFNEMSQKLQELDELKNDFVSSVSHELRSPVAAIKGFLQMFEMGITGPLNDRQMDNVKIMLQCTDRLTRFVNNILDVAKFEAGMVEFNIEPVDLRKVANEIVALFQAQAHNEKISLTLECDQPVPNAMCDPERMKQVYTNLINNAMKFTPAGGKVRVWIKEEGDRIISGITDTGAGIPKEDIPKLFNKFEQVKKTVEKAKAKGTGLGLAITKRIIDGMQGTIGIDSELGKGTTFFFTLAKAGSRQAPAAGTIQVPGGR